MLSFDYSLIKYTPDRRRGEVINIGLVVFKQKPEIHMLPTHNKLRLLDGESGIEDLNELRESFLEIASIGNTSEEQYNLLTSMSGSITLSTKAYFSVESKVQYQSKVAELFSQLVKPPVIPLKEERQSRIVTKIKREFKKLDILAKDPAQIDEHKVIPNFELSDQTGLTVDFLLKNGSYHITEAIDFNIHKIKPKYNETTMKTLAFIESREIFGNQAQRYLAYTVSAAKENQVRQHLNLAEKHCERMFNLESGQDSSNYYQMMENLALQGNTIN